ncbi:MAG: para-aminobenzoate synthetase/4-amino-4-deoxychorismate lyase [Acidimicrobiales bacterium]
MDALLDGVDADGPRRLRLLGAPDGGVELQVTEAPEPTTGAWDVPIDLEPVTSRHEFLFHKTTLREVYDDARARFPEAPDVLLWNELGELTETTIGNLVVRLDGRLVTPPVSCGLLPGTFRAQLLADGEVVEQVVRRGDLDRADGVWMVNSVRGWVPISLVYAGSRR